MMCFISTLFFMTISVINVLQVTTLGDSSRHWAVLRTHYHSSLPPCRAPRGTRGQAESTVLLLLLLFVCACTPSLQLLARAVQDQAMVGGNSVPIPCTNQSHSVTKGPTHHSYSCLCIMYLAHDMSNYNVSFYYKFLNIIINCYPNTNTHHSSSSSTTWTTSIFQDVQTCLIQPTLACYRNPHPHRDGG